MTALEQALMQELQQEKEMNLNLIASLQTQEVSFIETLEKAIGIDAKKNFLPMQAGDVVSTYADVSDLIEDFDYMNTK